MLTVEIIGVKEEDFLTPDKKAVDPNKFRAMMDEVKNVFATFSGVGQLRRDTMVIVVPQKTWIPSDEYVLVRLSPVDFAPMDVSRGALEIVGRTVAKYAGSSDVVVNMSCAVVKQVVVMRSAENQQG
jgi:hypothetical protein